MNDRYYISTNKSKLNIELIHDYLSNHSYWAKRRSLETVTKSIEKSFCFGLYDNQDKQIGFARIVTIFAWIMDVFVLEEYRILKLGEN